MKLWTATLVNTAAPRACNKITRVPLVAALLFKPTVPNLLSFGSEMVQGDPAPVCLSHLLTQFIALVVQTHLPVRSCCKLNQRCHLGCDFLFISRFPCYILIQISKWSKAVIQSCD